MRIEDLQGTDTFWDFLKDPWQLTMIGSPSMSFTLFNSMSHMLDLLRMVLRFEDSIFLWGLVQAHKTMRPLPAYRLSVWTSDARITRLDVLLGRDVNHSLPRISSLELQHRLSMAGLLGHSSPEEFARTVSKG